MEVAGGADLMQCEDHHTWSSSTGEEGEGQDEGSPCVVPDLPDVDLGTDSPPIRILPLPVEPVRSCRSPSAQIPAKFAGPAALSFRVNGRLVPPEPGGGRTELTLRCHPRGSASGFTSVWIPAPLNLHGPEEPRHNSTTFPVPTPAGGHTPIITGVVSGEAAHQVLSNNNANFEFSAPPMREETPPTGDANTTCTSTIKTRPPPHTKPGPRHKMLRKGELGPVSPPDCVVCSCQYKLIPELRGFMCMCSPSIAESLKELKKKASKHQRRSREENKTSRRSRVSAAGSPSKGSSSHWRTQRLCEDLLSDRLTGPAPTRSSHSPEQVDPPPQGKLVILVEDFYYGSAAGRGSTRSKPPPQAVCGPYACMWCQEMLPNNIRLMSHVVQHQDTAGPAPSCPHCLRHFLSELKLQQHVEEAHGRQSSVTCRICELAFGTEPDFLWHMKTTHKPGEMPYCCQVCDFRSSFFSEIQAHFLEAHRNTRNLQCHFCLRVLRSPTCYQQHLTRHQGKQAFSCYKCRLHFLYNHERVEHETSHHRTHVKPPQLSGLKPGTKVTVRTYSVVGGVTPCKVVDVPSPPINQPPPKRRKMESLRQLLWSPDPDRLSVAPPLCVECLTCVSDLSAHFPSLVHCSLCSFSTCCSASYANHMIIHHVSYRKNLQQAEYPHLFTSGPRLCDTLRCVSCSLSTHRGDLMANHLTERPQHTCIMQPPSGSLGCVEESNTTTEEGEESNNVTLHDAVSVTSPDAVGGAFLPVGLPPARQISTRLSVRPLPSSCPAPLSSPAALTIRFLGAGQQLPAQPVVRPLSRFQLVVVLSALCHGVSQAALRFGTSPLTIRSWIEQHHRGLPYRKWVSKAEPLVKWVLNRRENQLSVDEDVLLLMARTTLRQEEDAKKTTRDQEGPTKTGADRRDESTMTKTSPERDAPTMKTMASLGPEGPTLKTKTSLWEDQQLLDCYTWTVDFMLRQELGLQNHYQSGKLPRSILDRSRTFIHSLRSLIQARVLPPHAVACLDEFPVYVDFKRFHNQDQLAFQLTRSGKERPLLDVVLCALSDGTLLPPLLFFSGFAPVVPEGFPDNVLLEARPRGFTNQERLDIWIQKVWQPHVASHCPAESLLILDPYRGHQQLKFRTDLDSQSTSLRLFPAGCSCRLQPLDVCVTPVLRDFLQARWTQLVSDGGLDGLSLDPLALTLACWLSEVSFTLNSETHFLLRSFSSVYDRQQLRDRSEVLSMIAELTQAVSCPLETRGAAAPGPEPGPEPGPGPGPGRGPHAGGGAGASLHLKHEEDQSWRTAADLTGAGDQTLEELGGGGAAEKEAQLLLMEEEEQQEVKDENEEFLIDGLSAAFEVWNGDESIQESPDD